MLRYLLRTPVVLRQKMPRSASGQVKLLVAVVLLLALPSLAIWKGMGVEPSQVGVNASEMVVETIEQTPNRFNLVLKEKSGPRRLVVAVGPVEAYSIAEDLKLTGNAPPVSAYAMTRTIADELGVKIQRVVVHDANDRAFFAKVVLVTESREVPVDISPSDAIALAMRAKAPIFVDVNVLDRAGVVSGR